MRVDRGWRSGCGGGLWKGSRSRGLVAWSGHRVRLRLIWDRGPRKAGQSCAEAQSSASHSVGAVHASFGIIRFQGGSHVTWRGSCRRRLTSVSPEGAGAQRVQGPLRQGISLAPGRRVMLQSVARYATTPSATLLCDWLLHCGVISVVVPWNVEVLECGGNPFLAHPAGRWPRLLLGSASKGCHC